MNIFVPEYIILASILLTIGCDLLKIIAADKEAGDPPAANRGYLAVLRKNKKSKASQPSQPEHVDKMP